MKLFPRLLIVILLLIPFFSSAQTPSTLPFTGSKYQMDGTKGWYHADSGFVFPYRNAKLSPAGIQFNLPGRGWFDRYGDHNFYGYDGTIECQFLTTKDSNYIKLFSGSGSGNTSAGDSIKIAYDSIRLLNISLAALSGIVSGKQDALGYTPENVANKVNNLTSPNSTTYPTSGAVSAALSGKQDAGIYLVPGDTVNTWVPVGDSTDVTGYTTHYQLDTAKRNIRASIPSVAPYKLNTDSTAQSGYVTHYQDDTERTRVTNALTGKVNYSDTGSAFSIFARLYANNTFTGATNTFSAIRAASFAWGIVPSLASHKYRNQLGVNADGTGFAWVRDTIGSDGFLLQKIGGAWVSTFAQGTNILTDYAGSTLPHRSVTDGTYTTSLYPAWVSFQTGSNLNVIAASYFASAIADSILHGGYILTAAGDTGASNGFQIATVPYVLAHAGGGGTVTTVTVNPMTGTGITASVSNPTTTPSITVANDTSIVATRLRVQKAIDSLNAVIATKGTGTVTSVATNTGTGITGGTITGTGTIAADTSILATRLRVQKAIDSLNAVIGTKGTGSVTSVATGNGLSGGTITTSGTLTADTAILATRLRVQKAVDSLNALIAVKGTGSVTSVAAGYGTSFTSITTTGSVVVDTAAMATRVRVQKAVDSLNALIATKGSGTVTSVTGTANQIASTGGTTPVLSLPSGGTLPGTWALGTPASGTLTNCTFPTLNQNTTGSAAKWTTARNLAGNSVDGSANAAFANKFIVGGTTDAGLSAAQFLGALATGVLKNTTTTGVLSIAANSDLPAMSATVGGAVPTPPNDATKFLNGQGAFTVPAGSGGMSVGGAISGGTTNRYLWDNGGVLAELSGTNSVAAFNASNVPTAVTYTTTATGSTIMSRTTNGNFEVNNQFTLYFTVYPSASTYTYTADSPMVHYYGGTGNATVNLPSTSGLTGISYYIYSQGSGTITVKNSGGTTIATIAGNVVGSFSEQAAASTGWAYGTQNIVSASGTVSSIATDATLTGGPVTTSGTLGIATNAALPGAPTIASPGNSANNIITTNGTQTMTNKTLTSPTLTTPVLGTPSSGTLTSCTGLPLTTGVTGIMPTANGGFGNGATTATSATSGTMSVTMTSRIITVTPTGACTFNATGGSQGDIVFFVVTSGGSPSRTMTFGTNFKTTSTLATGTTAGLKQTLMFLNVDGTTWYEVPSRTSE